MTPAEQIAEFCAQILPERKRQGWTTTSLTEALASVGVNVAQSTVSRIERQLGVPDWSTAIGLSIILEIPMPYGHQSFSLPAEPHQVDAITKAVSDVLDAAHTLREVTRDIEVPS